MTKELVTTNKHRKEDQMANEVQNIAVDVLKVHPRNQEFFDDISGQDYENFKKSISEEGIISEIIVAPDMTIISGHQRYKAAKDLGMKMVPIRIREDLIDEDKKLKVLLAANFGRTKNDEEKQRKVAVEYVRLCGYSPNGDRSTEAQSGLRLTLDEIAHQLGTSKTNLKRALSIERNLTDSMKELLDTGIISKTLAADTIASLSPQEQEELISSLDTTKRITQKEMQKYIDEVKESKKRLESQVAELRSEKSVLETKVRINEENAERYEKLQSDINFLTKKKTDLGRQINSATELADLTVKLQKLLEEELAPIKFKRCMEELDSSDVCVENLLDIITKIDNWSSEMKNIVNKKNDVIVDIL